MTKEEKKEAIRKSIEATKADPAQMAILNDPEEQRKWKEMFLKFLAKGPSKEQLEELAMVEEIAEENFPNQKSN